MEREVPEKTFPNTGTSLCQQGTRSRGLFPYSALHATTAFVAQNFAITATRGNRIELPLGEFLLWHMSKFKD